MTAARLRGLRCAGLLGCMAGGSRDGPALTDRLGIRYGATVVAPLHAHPVVLAAWRF